MAGDWIKMRTNLWDDPRVSRLCDLTGSGEAAVIGALYWLWSAADEHTEDGTMLGLSVGAVDRKTGVPGIGAALVEIGWITSDPAGLTIARFNEHNGSSAKRRCAESRRKMSARDADKERAECSTIADDGAESCGSFAHLDVDVDLKVNHLSEQAAAATDCAVDNSTGVVLLPAAVDQERAKTIAERLNGWAKKRGDPPKFSPKNERVVEWVRLGVRDAHLKDAWDNADQARYRDGKNAPLHCNFLNAFIVEAIAESGLALTPPKPPDVCRVCGGPATRKEGAEWFCSAHDRFSKQEAAA